MSAKGKVIAESEMPVKPNSVVIEEIQSDAQKDVAQSGALRQTHGTLFKAAIEDALKRGATTVYYPTSTAISLPRGGVSKAERFAPIYDKQIVKEGLKPLSNIKGVEVKPAGVGGVQSYYEINFSPEAKKYILEGRGQRTPGYAKGGSITGFSNGGVVRYDASQVDNIVNQIRGGING